MQVEPELGPWEWCAADAAITQSNQVIPGYCSVLLAARICRQQVSDTDIVYLDTHNSSPLAVFHVGSWLWVHCSMTM
jgi:hypothetical protein